MQLTALTMEDFRKGRLGLVAVLLVWVPDAYLLSPESQDSKTGEVFTTAANEECRENWGMKGSGWAQGCLHRGCGLQPHRNQEKQAFQPLAAEALLSLK